MNVENAITVEDIGKFVGLWHVKTTFWGDKVLPGNAIEIRSKSPEYVHVTFVDNDDLGTADGVLARGRIKAVGGDYVHEIWLIRDEGDGAGDRSIRFEYDLFRGGPSSGGGTADND